MSSASSNDSISILTSLPQDLLRHTFAFLSGHELLAVSTVSRELHTTLETEECEWQKRLLPLSESETSAPGFTWRERYSKATSLRMSGLGRGAAIPLPEDYTSKWHSEAFSVDLWFCLLPADSTDPSSHSGGVILGAQSKAWTLDEEERQPEYHQQLIHVDTSGNLYCSATNKKEIVAAKLETNRWYHVALVHSQKLQYIYLNGALLRVTMEPLHVEWGKMKTLQFGSGFMSYGSVGRPTDHFVGWYGFHGLLDEQRVWDRALSMGDIQCLSHGESLHDDSARPTWSSTDSGKAAVGNFTRVRCNRPLERHCGNVAAVNN